MHCVWFQMFNYSKMLDFQQKCLISWGFENICIFYGLACIIMDMPIWAFGNHWKVELHIYIWIMVIFNLSPCSWQLLWPHRWQCMVKDITASFLMLSRKNAVTLVAYNCWKRCYRMFFYWISKDMPVYIRYKEITFHYDIVGHTKLSPATLHHRSEWNIFKAPSEGRPFFSFVEVLLLILVLQHIFSTTLTLYLFFMCTSFGEECICILAWKERPSAFACKSKNADRQDWYIFTYIFSIYQMVFKNAHISITTCSFSQYSMWKSCTRFLLPYLLRHARRNVHAILSGLNTRPTQHHRIYTRCTTNRKHHSLTSYWCIWHPAKLYRCWRLIQYDRIRFSWSLQWITIFIQSILESQ